MGLVKASNGKYYARFKQPNGKYTMRSLETKDETEAKDKYDQWTLNRGIIEIDRTVKHLRVSELYSKFYDLFEKSGKNAKEWLYPLIYLQNYLNDPLCNSISKYNVEMFKLWRSSQKKTVYNSKLKKAFPTKKTISPTSVNIEMRRCRSLFSKAVELNLVMHNPFKGFKQLTPVKVTKKTLTDSEIFQILNSASNQKYFNIGKKEYENVENTNMKHIIIYAYLTGCRLNEIINLEWSSVDFTNYIIHVENKVDSKTNNTIFKTKTNENRSIPMNDTLYEILQKQYSVNSSLKYVFGYINRQGIETKYTGDRVSKFFKRQVRKCGIDDSINFHCLRHTCISNLIKRDVNIYKVKEIVGHKDILTTQRYCHLDIESLRSAMDTATVPKAQ